MFWDQAHLLSLTIRPLIVDGLRIDSVKNVEKDFWPGFQSAAGIYIVGEVSDGDVDYACPYQQSLDAILNYPMYYQLTQFFQSPSATSGNLVNQIKYLNYKCKDSTLLGSFSENHDQARFPSITEDMSLVKNVIVFTMLADGIPIIYSGQEQHLNGGHDPYDREAIWLTGYNSGTSLYHLVAQLNQIRKRAINQSSSYVTSQSQIIYDDPHNLAFSKGHQTVAVYNNFGASAGTYTLNLSNTGFDNCAEVMEVLSCQKVNVGCNGILSATVTGGLPLVYFPVGGLKGSGICGQ